MQRRVLSQFSLPLQFAFLFLAVSVFGWGFQARLYQYKTNGRSSESVKMCTDKRSPLKALPAAAEEKPQPDFEKSAIRFIFAINHPAATLSNTTQQVELSLVTPSRYDAQGPGLMLRPPPANS
jgi:hypothetical protein